MSTDRLIIGTAQSDGKKGMYKTGDSFLFERVKCVETTTHSFVTRLSNGPDLDQEQIESFDYTPIKYKKGDAPLPKQLPPLITTELVAFRNS